MVTELEKARKLKIEREVQFTNKKIYRKATTILLVLGDQGRDYSKKEDVGGYEHKFVSTTLSDYILESGYFMLNSMGLPSFRYNELEKLAEILDISFYCRSSRVSISFNSKEVLNYRWGNWHTIRESIGLSVGGSRSECYDRFENDPDPLKIYRSSRVWEQQLQNLYREAMTYAKRRSEELLIEKQKKDVKLEAEKIKSETDDLTSRFK